MKILGKMVRVQTRSRLRMMKVRLPDVERTGSIRSLDEVRLLSKSRRLKKRLRMQERKRGVIVRPQRKKKLKRPLQSRLRRKEGEMAQLRKLRRMMFVVRKPAWLRMRSHAERRKSGLGIRLQRSLKRKQARKRLLGGKRRSRVAIKTVRVSRNEEERLEMVTRT